MASLNYDGNIVNQSASNLSSVSNEFNSIASSIKQATNKIVSAKGFNEYIGGISSDTFSNSVIECQTAVNLLVRIIRETQIKILSYSQDDNDIQAFLDTLDRTDYDSLDLSGIEDHITLSRKAKNIISGVGSSALTFGAGFLEGVLDFGETGADLICMGGTAIASIFTSVYDYANDTNVTEQIWKDTKAYVSEKKVESVFNSFYDSTELGQKIKNNAYGFETVRGVGKGVGYTSAIIGANILTGGLFSGGAGAIGATQLATTAGVFGFSNGAEEAWADGATLTEGLKYGVASGAWEAAQWYAGAKISQLGSTGGQVASGVFKNANNGVGTRIALDTVDSAAEGFAQPLLKTMYKDYEGETFEEKYKNAFDQNGGWQSVLTQALIGGVSSTAGELISAKGLFKLNNETDIENLRPERGKIPTVDQQEYFKTHTIDGAEIKQGNTIFNSTTTKTSHADMPSFDDGSYIPQNLSLEGVSKLEPRYTAQQMERMIVNSKDYMSATDFDLLLKANDVFKSNGLDVSANELKLIAFHSNGNTGRISDVLSSYNATDSLDIENISKTLSKEIFFTDVSKETLKRRSVINEYIDELRKNNSDSQWKSNDELISEFDTSKYGVFDYSISFRDKVENLEKKINEYFNGRLPTDTVKEIAYSDGYTLSIKDILETDGSIPADSIDSVSSELASKIFMPANMTRMKALYTASEGKIDSALHLIGGGSDEYSFKDLYRASDEFATVSETQQLYKSTYDYLINKKGLSEDEAANFVYDAYQMALDSRGYELFTKQINGEDINIRQIRDYRESSGTSASADKIIAKIEELPEQFQTLTKDYVVVDSFYPGDKKFERRYNIPDYEASMTNHGGGQYIGIWNLGYSNRNLDSIHHEIGHSIDSMASIYGVSSSSEWKAAMTSDEAFTGKKAVTEYGETFDYEDFADSIKLYFNDYDNFSKQFPARTKIIESLIKKYAK